MPQSYTDAQKLLPLLLDGLQDYALFLMDAAGTVVTWTPGVLRLLGYEESEFVGQKVASIFTAADLAGGLPDAELEAARENGRAESSGWRQRKDGTLFWGIGQMVALRDDDGTLRGFAKILRDETAHQQTRDALHETRQRLQTALDIGRIGTWEWDVQRNRVVADINLARYFRVSPEDAAGGPIEHYTAAVHPDDHAHLFASINRSLTHGSAYVCDYRLMQNDGSIMWVEARGQTQFDGHGKAAILNGVVLDITERKQAEDARRQSEERYHALFEAISSGFCVIEVLFDEAGNLYDYLFLETNPAFESQTGLSDVIGKTVLEMVPQHDKHWFEIYGRVAKEGEPLHFENSADALGREYDVHAFRIGDPEKRRVAVLFTDITDRKKGEDALRQAHAKAEETNRMKDEFLATLSHELRTPLNAILGWANILRHNQLETHEQQQGLETIERNARAQAQLINDLLDVSRILTGKLHLEMRPLNLADTLEGAIDTVAPSLASKQIQLEVKIDHTIGLVSGDKDRLAQVFWNLLSNSIKFTPRGGHIWVDMARVNGKVEVQIRDDGQGIAPDFLPFVFERFRQADASSTRAFGGLGIGLALVRHLIEAQGGSVHAYSEGLNHGSTFTVSFSPVAPRVPSNLAPNDVVGAHTMEIDLHDSDLEAQLPMLSGLRILVVDDETDARELVQLLLQQRGASVEVAEDAATAFATFEQGLQSDQPFDILVSDVAMPGEDGHSLIRRIRAREAETGGKIPAIALTAYASHKDRVNVLLSGFQAHIAKPVDPMELVASVAALTGRTSQEEYA